VNEVRCGIISDASTAQRKSNVVKLGRSEAGQANVNSLGLHVQAVFRHSGGMRPKKLVAPGRAIATNDIDFRISMAAERDQIPKQIEKPGIEVVNVSRSMIAEKGVQSRERV
jgi:hypothetical protein